MEHREELSRIRSKGKVKLAAVQTELQQEKERVQLNDSSTVALKLKDMGVDLAAAVLDKYLKKQARVNAVLHQMHFQVNNNQFCCAVAALCDQRKRRQFVTVPAGKSKMPTPILVQDG